jgi:hypothetical protein
LDQLLCASFAKDADQVPADRRGEGEFAIRKRPGTAPSVKDGAGLAVLALGTALPDGTSSSAAKIPAGPAPTMTTSY